MSVTKQEIIEVLDKHGVDQHKVEFHGSGDSGEVFAWYDPIAKDLEDLVYHIIDREGWSGYEINDGGGGEVTFSRTEPHVELSVYYNVTETHTQYEGPIELDPDEDDYEEENTP